MTIYEFGGKTPDIDPSSYVHPMACIMGNVKLGKGCYIGPNVSIRGDYGTITIGDFTAVEDNVVIHARPDEKCVIGNNVTLGHGCIIHNATIHDYAVIGMKSVVSDYSVLGEWAVVAEGGVVRSKQEVPAYGLAYGVPAKIKEDFVKEAYMEQWKHFKGIYVQLCDRYRNELKEVE